MALIGIVLSAFVVLLGLFSTSCAEALQDAIQANLGAKVHETILGKLRGSGKHQDPTLGTPCGCTVCDSQGGPALPGCPEWPPCPSVQACLAQFPNAVCGICIDIYQ